MGKWQNPSILIVAGVIYGILIATLWSQHEPTGDGGPVSPFWHAIWQWQTLVAGALALSGALFTVRAIRDQIETAREDSLERMGEAQRQFRTALEPQRLALDRAIWPLLEISRIVLERINEIRTMLARNDPRSWHSRGALATDAVPHLQRWPQEHPIAATYMSADDMLVMTDLIAALNDQRPHPHLDEANLDTIQLGVSRLIRVAEALRERSPS